MKKAITVKDDLYTLYQLTKRDIKLFLMDKAGVFFSLLAPLIVLLLYILFLADVQVMSVKSYIPQGIEVDSSLIKAYVDSWMVAGVVSVACITVAFGANSIMVQDKTKGILNDGLSAPVKKYIIKLSYFVFNFLVTLFIVAIVFAVCLIYLFLSGGWCLSAKEVFILLGVLILSVLSSTLITVFICSFFKTEAVLGAVSGIMSAVLGFLIGAYMPMSIMPKVAQNISAFVPGSHSAGLFRQYFMRGPLEKLGDSLPAEVTEGIAQAFSMEMKFFDGTFQASDMFLYLGGSIIIFLALNAIVAFTKKRKKK